MTTSEPAVLLSHTGHRAVIEFHNPSKYNAMTLAMWRELASHVRAAAEEDTRCIVLRGSGTRAFVSGADLSRFETERSGADGAKEYEKAVAEAVDTLAACPVPTIAAIQGICYGGGLMIAAACDFRIVSTDARFCIPATKLGLAYPRAAAARLVGLVGPAHAKRILMGAVTFTAEKALDWGFADQCSDPQSVDDAVDDLARTLEANAPLAVAAAKMAVDHAAFGQHDAASVDAASARCALSEDFREGQAAFAQKRPPEFRGR